MKRPAIEDTAVKSGNAELDHVLGGGFARHRVYLLQGSPGSGKTTLALEFLLEGIKNDETVLYLTLSESEAELQTVAASHGWSLDKMNIFELLTTEEALQAENQYTMY
ncbi:MAG: circadian clock protein KaiC, partial [Alphaproteobacteria bacterium]|nr:circadian clock protein KaiC [Alphaproteobacteria bacterium]